MSAFRLRKFGHPDALKAIAPERLRDFLDPYVNYFLVRGVEIRGTGDLDYDRLAAVLIDPDEDVPEHLVSALYVVNEMADDDVMERLIATARTRHIDLQLDDGPTAADVAVAMWLADRELLQELHAESLVARPRSFEYYSGDAGCRRNFPPHEAEKIAAMEAELGAWFVDHKRGISVKIFVFPRGDRVYLLVRHGTTMWREGRIDKGERGVAYYRPEVHDVLVYDETTDTLGLKAGTKGEKTLYRRVIGSLLFGAAGYFEKPLSLSLLPLRERGPEILACEDIPGMNSVRLVEIRRFLGGETKQRSIDQSTDLFRAFGTDWQRHLNAGMLVGATFEVLLGGSGRERKRRVTITQGNIAKYDRDDDDAETIETWLRRRGLMPGSELEERDGAPPLAPVLADSGRAAGADDRTAGLAAAPR